jgi:hypothetical protein
MKLWQFFFAFMLSVAATLANAALDASISTGLDGIKSDATAILALVFPVVIAVLALQLSPRLVKRFSRSI